MVVLAVANEKSSVPRVLSKSRRQPSPWPAKRTVPPGSSYALNPWREMTDSVCVSTLGHSTATDTPSAPTAVSLSRTRFPTARPTAATDRLPLTMAPSP
eukprot:5606970-Pleurochrysis_carterae.AAC.1